MARLKPTDTYDVGFHKPFSVNSHFIIIFDIGKQILNINLYIY